MELRLRQIHGCDQALSPVAGTVGNFLGELVGGLGSAIGLLPQPQRRALNVSIGDLVHARSIYVFREGFQEKSSLPFDSGVFGFGEVHAEIVTKNCA